MSTEQVAAAVVSLVACATDLRARRIPNVLTLGAALAALVWHTAVHGSAGTLAAAGGWALGLALFLPFFALRGLGAGDVKLLAAVGAWLGPAHVFWVAVYAAVAGGVLAVCLALATGYAGTMVRNLWVLLTHWRVTGVRPLDSLTLASAGGPRLAYAVPIAAGVGLTLWLR
jgi:prepilin peptidase CpaA